MVPFPIAHHTYIDLRSISETFGHSRLVAADHNDHSDIVICDAISHTSAMTFRSLYILLTE